MDSGLSHYDAVVIGGGHNGLICAALFAKAGARVLVCEKRATTGGCTDTSAPWPEHADFLVNTYSYVAGLMPRRIVAELDLTRHGLKVYPYGPLFHAFPDGRCLALHEDPAKSYESIARFSRKDAEAFPRWEAWLGRMADLVWPAFMTVPPGWGSIRSGEELLDLLKVGWSARRLGRRGVAEAAHLLKASAAEILDDWFESDEVKGVLAMEATIGAWAGPMDPATAYILLHLSMGDPGDGHLGGWGFARGGMGGLAAACRRAAAEHGAEIRTGAAVVHVGVREGRATSVVLESDEEIGASIVVSTIHPKTTFLNLVDRSALPSEFVRRIERFKSRGGAVKINLALGELPDFGPAAPADCHTGSLEVAFSPRYVQTAFDEARAGRPAAHPIADGTIPSTLDDSLMPAGHHCMSIYSQWVPKVWHEEPHRDELESFADRVIGAYAELAPNLPAAIIERQVLGPHDFEQELGLIGGNVYGGELTIDQLFHRRPALGYGDYRSPIRGLYNGSAGAHGGGGVSGIPGWQAFRQAMKDGKRR